MSLYYSGEKVPFHRPISELANDVVEHIWELDINDLEYQPNLRKAVLYLGQLESEFGPLEIKERKEKVLKPSNSKYKIPIFLDPFRAPQKMPSRVGTAVDNQKLRDRLTSSFL